MAMNSSVFDRKNTDFSVSVSVCMFLCISPVRIFGSFAISTVANAPSSRDSRARLLSIALEGLLNGRDRDIWWYLTTADAVERRHFGCGVARGVAFEGTKGAEEGL